MAAQLSYDLAQPLAYQGLIYAQFPSEVISLDASTVIPFGLGVSRVVGAFQTDKEQQVQLGVDANGFFGVSVRSLDREGAANTGVIEYQVTDTVPVIRSGYVWVICVQGCIPGDEVKVDNTTGIFGNNTNFPAGIGETIVSGTWETSATAGKLAVLRLTDNNE